MAFSKKDQPYTPIISMRPGRANNCLANRLEALDFTVWRWPAFTIELPEDTMGIAQALANLDDIDMVIIPSPSAVAAVAYWIQEWPEHVRIATVGQGSAKAISLAWPNARVVCPEGGALESGSEALWQLIRQRRVMPKNVLFLRGQTGREWLPLRFQEMGCHVMKVCAYVRVPIILNERQIHRLTQALTGPSPVVYVTSTDAVDALVRCIRVVPGAREWLSQGIAITIHPRVAARLREAGFRDIRLTQASQDRVIAEIQNCFI